MGKKENCIKNFVYVRRAYPFDRNSMGVLEPLQMSAAAFAKGLLDLEGELTPIMVELLHCIWNVVEGHIVGVWVEMLLSGLNWQCWRELNELSTLRRKTLL
jgi:hypothetical protein